MNTRLLYLLPQILPQILQRLSKNSFRENRFVFGDGPEDAAGKAAEAAKAAKEAGKEEAQKKGEVVATGGEATAKAADSKAVDTVQPDPIDKELSTLDQAKFDQLMEKVNKGTLERTMTPAQVETLVTFAKTNEPQKNLQTLFTAISEAKITADQLNLNSVKIIIEHVQSDLAKFTKLFAILSKSSTPASYMLEATADNPSLLKEAYASIKDNQVVITNLSPEGLAVLVNKIDLTDLLGKLTVDQKAACLISTKVDDPKKELILGNLIDAKANMSEYMTNVSEAIISYILEKSPKHLATTLTQKLDEASIKKLSYKSAKELVEKTVNNKDLTALYANILKSIQAPTKKAIIDDKTAKLEARLALYDTLTEEEKKHSFKPGEEPGAEKGEAKTESKAETFTKDMDLAQRIEKAGLKLVKKGKSVGWSFDVLNNDGLMTTSERSFLKTKKFLKELNKTDSDGKLIYDTSDKVKLCAYKWLWEQIYKGGKVKKNKYKVEEFDKSQERLQQEIAKLEAAASGKPAPATEDRGKDKAKAEAPAAAPTAAPAAAPAAAPKAAEPAAPAGDAPKAGETAAPAEPATTGEADAPIAAEPAAPAEPATTGEDKAPKAAAPDKGATPPAETPGEAKAPADAGTAETKAEAKPESEEEQMRRLFFSNFSKVEKTTRTIETGDYQFSKESTIYMMDGPQYSNYILCRYFTIEKPEILQLTDKTGKNTYVVRAKNFREMGGNGKLIPSGSVKDKGNGFVNVEDIIKGHEFSPTAETKPKIESEWGKPEDPGKAKEDTNLISGKQYKIKPGTEYYTNSPSSTLITSTDPVKLMDTKVREVEGKQYVQVTIEGKKDPVWISRDQIIVSEEDIIRISSKATDKAEELPEGVKIDGKFKVTGEMRGSEVLEAIFKDKPAIKGLLEGSGLSNIEYLKLITKYRKNDTLPIIVPEKQLSVIMAEYEGKAANLEYQRKDSEAKDKIFKGKTDYLDRPRYLTNPELVKAINNDALWNDLLAKRGPYEKTYIEGFAKVANIMEKFGVTGERLRGELKNLLQIGINEKVTFEEIFDKYFMKKGYVYSVDEDGDKEGSFKQFKQEIGDLEKSVQPWQTPAGKAKMEKIDQWAKAVARVKLVKEKAERDGTDFTKSEEFKEYERLGKETQQDRSAFLSRMDSEGKDTGKTIPEKFARLQYLKDQILFPIAELLDALVAMNVKVSKEQTFMDKYEAVLSSLPQTKEIPTEPRVYYSLESLMKGEGKLDPIDEKEKVDAITVSKNAKDQFGKVIEDLVLQDVLTQNQFDDKGILKLILQLYSIDTLIKDNCLQKAPNSNRFILNSLPKNFNAKEKAVVSLFKEISNDSRIDSGKQKIREISETLDRNKGVVKRLLEVFSKDKGPKTYDLIPIDLLGISYLVRALDGEDRRELSLVMQDIGEGKDTLLPSDFLNRYLSDGAAFSEILSKISTTKNGAEIYDENSLKTEFNRRALHGLSFSIINSKNNPQLYKDLTQKYGDLKKPENFLKAKEDLAKKINDSGTPLDQTTRELIRIGHVIDGAVEESKEKDALFSKNPNIKNIQKQLFEKGAIKSLDDIRKVDTVLGGGLVIPLNGNLGVGIFSQVDLGNDWKLTPAVGITGRGVDVGVGISKGLELSKDGRTVLTLGVSTGVLHIGGAASLQIPISKEWNANIGAAAGVSAVGFYALGCIGFSKDLNAAAIEALKEEVKSQGYSSIEKMSKAGKPEKEIADALVKLPGDNGALFREYRSQGVPDSGLLEMYSIIRQSIDSKTTKEGTETSVIPKEGGFFIGMVGATPVVGAYLSWVVADRTMIVRRVVPGAPEYSNAQVEAALEKKLGKKVQIMKTKAGASGDIVYDATSKKMAILDDKETINLREFDGFAGFNSELGKAHMGISKEQDGSIRLNITNPRETKANIKVLADPELQEDGIVFTVVDNKIIFKGLSDKEMRNLIITRENFHYPFENESANKLSVITIKNNPKRTREKIEQESPNFIYQSAGFRPEIREGIAKDKSTPVILDGKAYGEVRLKASDTASEQNLEDFADYQKAKKTAINVISKEEFGKVENPETLFKFADKFYAKNKRIFRELTTKKTDGNDKYDPDKLTALIQAAANKDKTIGKDLNSAELNQIIIHMIGKTLIDAKNRKSVFEKNLEFCKERVLKPFLTTAKKDLKLDSTVESMLGQIDKDMRKNVDLKSKDFEEFEKGTYFLSAVGTMGIKGLRGTPYYGTELDTEYGILNFNKYDPGDKGVEGDLGRALLSIASPLDTSNDKKFMESPIAMKLIAIDAMYLVLGPEDARKVVACFGSKKVEAANKDAFEKFKAIVMQVREAENQGKNYVPLDNGYEIRIKNIKVGLGNYSKCTNPTMAVTEDFEIYGPPETGTVVEHDQRIRVTTTAVRKAIKLIVGVKIDLPKDETPPPPEKPPGPKPEAGPGGSVDQHVGGTPAPAEGAGTQASQGGGGNSMGGAGASQEAVGSGGAGN